MQSAPSERESERYRIKHSLGFLALLAFVASILAARAFTTLAPNTVVVSGGIHFHHFWYGLAMIFGAGWLGIVYNRPGFDRVYAVVFGLGAGIIGDEVGLLLTLGDYHSELTYVFFVISVAVGSVLILLATNLDELKRDLSMEWGERILYIGIGLGGLSAVPLAFGIVVPGVLTATVGAAMIAGGYYLHRRSRQPR